MSISTITHHYYGFLIINYTKIENLNDEYSHVLESHALHIQFVLKRLCVYKETYILYILILSITSIQLFFSECCAQTLRVCS